MSFGKKLRRNIGSFFLGYILIISLIMELPEASAIEHTDSNASVLVVYSSEKNEIDFEQRVLDMALGHFSEDIAYINTSELSEKDLAGVTHLFYYGLMEEKIPEKAAEIITLFDGPTVAIGKNVENLGKKFDFIEMGEEETITEINILNETNKKRIIEPNTILGIDINKEAEVLVEGKGKTGTYPFITQLHDSYYIASDKLIPPYSVYFSQILNQVFNAETSKETPAYLRLEDVHPLADAEGLMEIAEYLKEKNIPYMIAAIPVYTHPETGREYHFHDAPEVLKALQYMQENGGSVILHGYTHQFREDETGEGFEFWDVEHDMPVYHGPDEEPRDKKESDFEKEADYLAYQEENIQYETEYVRNRLTRGVQELTNYGLYPLAFEAPHYTMSQNGYKVVSEHFSTYVGQLQLSDEDWETMESTPYAGKPSILHGMTLLPETIGYVQPDDSNAVEKMMEKAEEHQITEGGMIGGFYHPYLGIDGLKEVVQEMENIPNIDWIDLKELGTEVNVENVSIKGKNGSIQVEVDQIGLMTTSKDFPVYHIKQLIEKVTWGIAGIGGSAVIMFIGYTIFQRPRRRFLTGRVK
ncbi:DUF2334 domain-containing protein [Alkalicoccus daliensis]|uniref:Uncharacterized protein YdaL n=1 Tax=Alkalicoccus daliensis TaxID=745820 RepID=A0A1H0HWW0_9BACI|nr:polysaccharide deacetylase family protein [Alkalicoccus daliensis]SDO23647.1 Uncharacterized protein YdaL [Alkalicoccus daliensis]